MNHSGHRFLIAGAVTLLLGAAGRLKAADRRLPPAAARVIQANFPDAKITGIGKERERGAWYYEVNLKDDGRRFEVEVTKEGVIGEIEARIKISDIPAGLLNVIRRRVADGRVTRVEKHERRGIARNGKFVPLKEPRIMYEVKYRDRDGNRREVEVRSNRILELPETARSQLAARFPRARISEVEAEDDEGIMIYVVTLRDGQQTIEVDILGDGRILEIETAAQPGQIPPNVSKVLNSDRELRRTDGKRILRRETWAAVEDGEIVGRHDVTFIAIVTRGDRMREYRFDGRGKLLGEPEWEDAGDGDDDD